MKDRTATTKEYLQQQTETVTSSLKQVIEPPGVPNGNSCRNKQNPKNFVIQQFTDIVVILGTQVDTQHTAIQPSTEAENAKPLPVKEPKQKNRKCQRRAAQKAIPDGPVRLSADLLHPEVTTQELEQVDAKPRSLSEIYAFLQTRVNSLIADARVIFPSRRNETDLLIKYVSVHLSVRDCADLDARISAAERENSMLRSTYEHSKPADPYLQNTQPRHIVDPEKEIIRLRKEIKLAEVKLAKLREEESDEPPTIQHKTGLDGTIDKDTIQMSMSITRMRETNTRLQNEVDVLEQKLSSTEKRVSLMTQKKSVYSPRLGASKKISIHC